MARTNLQIKVGTYTGNGVDDRNITGIGFRPDLVIVKGGANNAVMKTDKMSGNNSEPMSGAVATYTDAIQELQNDGFQIGTLANVNANETVYYYIAIRGLSGQNYFRTGKYTGDGADDRNFITGGLGFTPDIVVIKRTTALNAVVRTLTMIGDLCGFFNGIAFAANYIQSLITNGFQLGTAGEVNSSDGIYNFFALKKHAGMIAVGSYMGNGLDNRVITGIGFRPDVVILKNASTGAGLLKTSDLAGDAAFIFGTGSSSADRIQSLDNDGFSVGTQASANGNGIVVHWIALKAGNHNVPIIRTVA